MAGQGTPEWIRGTDNEVRAKLGETLKRFGGAPAHDILGVHAGADAGTVRAAFLTHTKIFHPARYARRPADVRELSNEVFLLMKEAHDNLRDGVPATRKTLKELAAESPVAGQRSATASTSTASTSTAPTSTASTSTAPTSTSRTAPNPVARGTAPGRVAASTRRQLLKQRRTDAENPEAAARRTGREAASMGAVVSAIQNRERDHLVAFAEAKELLTAEKFEQAVEAFRKLAAANPDERQYLAYLHYTWATEARLAGDLDKARAEYSRAIQRDPTFTKARADLERVTPKTGTRRKNSLFKKLFGDDS